MRRRRRRRAAPGHRSPSGHRSRARSGTVIGANGLVVTSHPASTAVVEATPSPGGQSRCSSRRRRPSRSRPPSWCPMPCATSRSSGSTRPRRRWPSPRRPAAATVCDLVAIAETKMKGTHRRRPRACRWSRRQGFRPTALNDLHAGAGRTAAAVPDAGDRLRHRLDHAAAAVRGAEPAGAGGLQELVRLRVGAAAGVAGARDAEARGRFLDQGRARRRADPGHCRAADHASQVGIRAPARVLRRDRGHADSPVQARTAPVGHRDDFRRPVRVRPRRVPADVRRRQARAVFGEGADKADTRIVDPKVVQQIWQDFAAAARQRHSMPASGSRSLSPLRHLRHAIARRRRRPIPARPVSSCCCATWSPSCGRWALPTRRWTSTAT